MGTEVFKGSFQPPNRAFNLAAGPVTVRVEPRAAPEPPAALCQGVEPMGETVARRIDIEAVVDLFASMGAALWHTQNVEIALHTYIAFKDRIRERDAVSADEAESIIETIGKKPLGRVVKLSENAEALSGGLQQRVKDFSAERRWLVHWSVSEYGNRLVVDEKYFALVTRFTAYTDEARALHRAIQGEFEDFVVSKGVSREWIERKAHELYEGMKDGQV